MAAKFVKSFVIYKKYPTFVAKKIRKRMKHLFLLLYTILTLWTSPALSALPLSSFLGDSLDVDTLRQVEVRADSIMRINESIRQTLAREKAARIGVSSVSDVIGSKATDKILHPFAVKDRKRDKKHAQDRKLLEEYEKLGRVKTFEELLDEAIRKQAIEDGKEPPVQSGKK